MQLSIRNKLLYFVIILFISIPKDGYSYSNIYVTAQNAAYCLDHNGALKWSFPHSHCTWDESSPAIAEINNDGEAEMVFCTADNVYCLGIDNGTLKWSYAVANWSEARIDLATPTIANIDTTGDPEIIVPGRDTVYCFNSDGTIKWGYAMTIPYQTYSQSWSGAHATVANIDGVGTPEVIAVTPKNVFCINSNGTLKWSYPMTGNDFGGVAVADVDLDGNPEIIVSDPYNGHPDSCRYYIYCLRPNGTLKWKHYGIGIISQTSIADINKDSKPDIVAYNSENPINQLFNRKTVAFKLNSGDSGLDVLWTTTCIDFTYVSASFPVLCDLDGDGDKDVLLEDCVSWPPTGTLHIFNGMDGLSPDNLGGASYTNDSFATETIAEHPVSVAEIDEDGHIDVVGLAHDSAGAVNGVAVLSSDSWANGRILYTSERYHITDINDDLTVPKVEPNNWQSHNTWATQLTTGGIGWGTPCVKWIYTNSSFGEIYSSIAIAPVVGGGAEEKNIPKNAGIQYITPIQNGRSIVKFSLSEEAKVCFYVFDISGSQKMVRDLGTLSSGSHNISVDFTSLANGIYFLQAHLGEQEFTCKTILIR